MPEPFAIPRDGVRVIERPPDVSHLDPLLLDADGHLKLLPYSSYAEIPRLHLAIWASLRARYCLPTAELIEWLRETIGDRKAIEIGSGHGDLAHHLGIQGTDSGMQQRPEVLEFYRRLGQAPTQPGPDVLRMDAAEAIDHFRPDVVVGAWITHRHTGGDVGSIYGPEEEKIIDRVGLYIHVGSAKVHKKKPIRRVPHIEYRPNWLVSRAFEPGDDLISFWGD